MEIAMLIFLVMAIFALGFNAGYEHGGAKSNVVFDVIFWISLLAFATLNMIY